MTLKKTFLIWVPMVKTITMTTMDKGPGSRRIRLSLASLHANAVQDLPSHFKSPPFTCYGVWLLLGGLG
jgi:hypothetical protein